jgi:hypothetical protein
MRESEQAMVRGAKQAMGEWVADLAPWQFFITHTYDHAKVARRRLAARGIVEPSLHALRANELIPLAVDVAWAHWRRWIRDVSVQLQTPALVFTAVEPQKSGWPHFHTLASLPAAAPGTEIAAMHHAWFPPHGFIKCERPRGRAELAAFYATKLAGYTTKSLGDGAGWRMSRELEQHVRCTR